MEKRCTKCNRLLPSDCFVKDKSKSDGLYSSCKSCVSERQKKEREQFPEHVKSRAKKFRDENIDRINTARRERYAENPEYAETVKQRAHNFRVNNPDSARDIDRRKYEKNKERYKVMHREYYLKKPEVIYAAGYRYRARKNNLPAIYDTSDWENACNYFNNKCAICDNNKKLSADHWIPLLSSECPGTVIWNIVPLCRSCNCSKKASNGFEWILRRYDYETSIMINSKIENFLSMQKGI